MLNNINQLSIDSNLFQTLFIVTIVPIVIQYGNQLLALFSEKLRNRIDRILNKFNKSVSLIVESEYQDVPRKNDMFTIVSQYLNDVVLNTINIDKIDNGGSSMCHLIEYTTSKNSFKYYPQSNSSFHFFVNADDHYNLIYPKEFKVLSKSSKILEIRITYTIFDQNNKQIDVNHPNANHFNKKTKQYEIKLMNSSKKAELDEFLKNIVECFMKQEGNNQSRMITITSQSTIDRSIERLSTFDGLLMNDTTRQEIRRDIQQFWNNGAHCAKVCQPHRFGLFLVGKPGTGKTSLLKCIAAESLPHIVDIVVIKFPPRSSMCNFSVYQTLERAQQSTIKGNKTVWIIEDIDCIAEFLGKRSTDDKISDTSSGLSAFLNMIDGMDTPENLMICFTSNHPEKLDPATIRPGRMDKILNCDNIIDYDSLIKFGERMFSDVNEAKKPNQSFYQSLIDKKLTNASIVQITKRYRTMALFDSIDSSGTTIIDEFVKERQKNNVDSSIFI